MYSFAQLSKGIENPDLAVREVNALYHTRLRRWDHNKHGVNVLERDWDNLVLLDACRVDMFRDKNPFAGGSFSTVLSRGSDTVEFLRGNLDGNQYLDTAYVTASPQLYRLSGDQHGLDIDTELHDSIEVWEDNWAEDAKTVKPDRLTDAALEAAADYPDKRLLVHYMQPHAPFLGPTAREHFDRDSLSFDWRKYRDVPDELLWKAYEETLEAALPHVERLVENLRGKTVLSSDHGQLMGERGFPVPVKLWGHPRHHYIEELIRVPWYVPEYEERKTVRAEPKEGSQRAKVDSDIVSSRLENLGYK